MAVDDVGADRGGTLCHMLKGRQVTWPDLAAHRHAGEPMGEHRREIGELRFGLRAAADQIGHHGDPVAALRLSAREVGDMTKQPAHRCAQHMENVEGFACRSRRHVETIARAGSGAASHGQPKKIKRD